jgi:Zn-dependent protease
MDSMPNQLPDLQFQQVGNYVRVFNPHNGIRYKLPLKQALLLLSLDGESWPGENTGLDLSNEELFNGLKKLYRNGLLKNAVQKPTLLHEEPGMALLLFPFPRFLQQGLLPILFYEMLRLLWLPLLILATVVVIHNGGWSCLPPLDGYSALLPPAAFLLNIVLHEISHAAAGCRFGIPADAFGVGISRFMPCAATFFSLLPYAGTSTNVGISVAGPLANLFVGSAALLLSIPAQSRSLLYLAICSYTLGCINLLPFSGLDGSSLRDLFTRHPKIGCRTALRALAACLAALASGCFLRFLPAWASFFIVLVLTSAAALLLPSRRSVFWARMLSTCCLLPVTMKILGFEPLFSDFFTCLTSIGFCMLQSYLVGPVLLELIFATYLYQK